MSGYLTCQQALEIMRANRTIDLYMGNDYRHWGLTYGWGEVTEATVDEMLRSGHLARKWAEMPCYYVYGDSSIEKVVAWQDEVMIEAVRDPDLQTARRLYFDYEQLRRAERKQRDDEKRARARAKRMAQSPG